MPMSCAALTVPVTALAAAAGATRHENWPSAPADDCWMGILSAPLGRGAGASSSSASADACRTNNSLSISRHIVLKTRRASDCSTAMQGSGGACGMDCRVNATVGWLRGRLYVVT